MRKVIVTYFCSVSAVMNSFDTVLGEFSILQDIESKIYSIKATTYLGANWFTKSEGEVKFYSVAEFEAAWKINIGALLLEAK